MAWLMSGETQNMSLSMRFDRVLRESIFLPYNYIPIGLVQPEIQMNRASDTNATRLVRTLKLWAVLNKTPLQ